MTQEPSEQRTLAAIFRFALNSDLAEWSELSKTNNEIGFPVREFENSATHARVTLTQMDSDLFNIKATNFEANLRFPSNW